jgi:uncharacterized membrane protein YbaN (DUF454 family)
MDAPSWWASCATRCIFCQHASIEQLKVEGHPFLRSRTDTQTFIIKSMNFYNRSTTIIKSMIIKKKTNGYQFYNFLSRFYNHGSRGQTERSRATNFMISATMIFCMNASHESCTTDDRCLFVQKRVPWMFFIIIQPPSHAKMDAPSWWASRAACCIFCQHAPIEQLNVEGHPFLRSRTDTQTVIIKSMNFYNRSTTIIKSMIIKKKTTTLSLYVSKSAP